MDDEIVTLCMTVYLRYNAKWSENIHMGWTIFSELFYRPFSTINTIPATNLIISAKTEGQIPHPGFQQKTF
jgi:hypothetical protein